MERAMNDLQGRLSSSDKPVSIILAENLNKADDAGRQLIVLCHGALDDIEDVLEALDAERPWVRDSAVEALRHWLARSAGQRDKLKTILLSRYKESEVDVLLHLLRVPTDKEREEAATFAYLIDELDNDKLAIRHLAHWHLLRLAYRDALKLRYDPNGPTEQRKDAQAKWKELLDKGKLPPEPPPPPR